MSHVTSVMLCIGLGEEDDEGNVPDSICAINDHLKSYGRGQLIKVSEMAGGTQVFSMGLWIGAFNHLDIPAFLTVVKEQQWEDPDLVQVFLNDEHDSGFSLRLSG